MTATNQPVPSYNPLHADGGAIEHQSTPIDLASHRRSVGAFRFNTSMSDNLERQLDELSAMQSMYDVEITLDDIDLERLRTAASAQADDNVLSALPELQFLSLSRCQTKPAR